jgi:hypothetical protein
MKKTLATLAAFGLALSTTVAVAQPFDFDTADSDKGGGVSLTELQTLFPDVTDEDFRLADTDGSGELSLEEYDSFVATSRGGSGDEEDGDDDDDDPDDSLSAPVN